jgi:hypothetical protein
MTEVLNSQLVSITNASYSNEVRLIYLSSFVVVCTDMVPIG